MRELTLILVLANLAFLGWRLWLAPEAEVVQAPVRQPTTVPRLLLASELDPAREGGERLAEIPATSPPPDAAATAPDTPPSDAATDAGAQPAEAPPAASALDAAEAGTGAGDSEAATDGPRISGSASSEVTGPETGGALTVATGTASPPRCVSMGPFLDLTEAADAAARLRDAGYSPAQRLAESQIWVGHWVYLPAPETREQAVELVQALRDQGVTDIYIEPAGELENAISLGLFSNRVRAETRAGDARRQGYAPQIRDRYRLASVYWVDITLAPGVELNAADYQTQPGRIIRLERRSCDGEGSAGETAAAQGGAA